MRECHSPSKEDGGELINEVINLYQHNGQNCILVPVELAPKRSLADATMVLRGSYWYLVVPNCPCWFLVIPGSTRWFLLVPAGSWWSLVVIGGFLWYPVAPCESKLYLLVTGRLW